MIERHTHTHWKQGTDPRILRWLLQEAKTFREHVHDRIYIFYICVYIYALHGNEMNLTLNLNRDRKVVLDRERKNKSLLYLLLNYYLSVYEHHLNTQTDLTKVAVTAEEFALACT